MLENHDLVHMLKTAERGLMRHFSDDCVVIHGCAMHVDELREQLQHHIASVERIDRAIATWVEALASLRDELDHEIGPLLASLRTFLVEELGADSPRLRDFGFQPGAAIAPTGEE